MMARVTAAKHYREGARTGSCAVWGRACGGSRRTKMARATEEQDGDGAHSGAIESMCISAFEVAEVVELKVVIN
jgi:hypothetical protein